MDNTNVDELNIAFFGTPEFFTFPILNALNKAWLTPSLIVTAPDRPAGRGMEVTSPPPKIWGEEHNVSVYQPEKIDKDAIAAIGDEGPWDLFIVAAFGKILPKELLGLPKHGTLNAHPSLLPRYRGATPIPSAILAGDKETGMSIMLMDEEMDHGPVLEQKSIVVGEKNAHELGDSLAYLAGEMFLEIVPRWTAGEVEAQEQDHDAATYTKKITKADGELNLEDSPEINWRKFRAYTGWPGTYFFTKDGRRVKITDATLENGKFVIKKVIPEGGKEMEHEQFIKN